ncbi:E3 ubiquitin-protein ligase COP1 isoform X1 [Nicotiana tabacum]|uniref:E3 ubiquitin-protein ligase COP1 isoform X1 n=4 Tax=Nicotiana TaxID=4085 RepID=A0A1S3Y7W3_TOBAC|nr:PREDICTED: E3 ubiquitin-protein ligase COP1-like isoform X2 [Nicotiana sylvestris]XP_016448273.1 PREDICTED: E3 ubiquitin-protein ligase COP1-like isoform X1 [Nicotiana tabacum]
MGGGGERSTGALVPTVLKSEPVNAGETSAPAAAAAVEAEVKEQIPVPEKEEEVDKDMLCPICMQIIKDAFLTACGHSFCYMCIVTHLHNKSDCPCCSHYLTTNHLYPNFLLNKLLMKRSARQMAKSATPVEQLRQAIQQGCEVSIKELESLLFLLMEKKRKMEQEEAETNLQILLEFLQCLRKQKVEEFNEIQNDLKYIKEDINAVEKRRIELYRARSRYSAKMRKLVDDSSAMTVRPSLGDKEGGAIVSSSVDSQEQGRAGTAQTRNTDARAPGNSQVVQWKDDHGGPDSQRPNQPGQAIARKKRIHAQFNELQTCYLQKRRYWARQSEKQEERVANVMNREGYSAGLEDFQSVLSTYTRYSRLRVVAELRHSDLFHMANIVSSIEFDRDDELFATAGVSRRIKVFEFASVVNEPAEAQCPLVEMSTRSKLSCLSWNKCTKNHLASSDYEGIVTVWDVTTRQSVMEYEEHEKRAWSVDFCRTEPSVLVSGSDDCKVKVWCTKQEASVLTIDMKANACSVKYNPGSSVLVAVGSADHHIHYYDLRNVSQPLHIFSGHRKAVSYVKFLSNNELASASTDSTLRLWDVKENVPLRTFKGHANEKNFVGLTVNSEYLACGSETNEVFVYHKEISKPAAWHKFGSDDQNDPDGEMGSYFISAVCWKRDSSTILTANSQGTIKVLVLAA